MTLELAPWALVFVAVVCLVAGFAHGALGFGFPMLATPLLALVLDIKSAIVLLAPITLVLVLISMLRGGRVVVLLRQFWFLPFAIVLGSWAGSRLLLAAPPEPFLLVLAGAILLYLNLDRLGRGRSALVERLRVPFGVLFGLAAGALEAVANVAGPALLIYFMLAGLSPLQLVQTLNLCFFFGKSTQVATLSLAGVYTPPAWAAIAGLTLPAVAALAIGMRLRERIDAATYRRWLRKALWVMALLILGQFATSAFASGEKLFEEIENGRQLAAVALVARGEADVNARNAKRETPLHRAIEKDMRGLAQALVRAGASLYARTANGATALHLAALHADPYYVDLLLTAGADPMARNDDGESVLFWALLARNQAVADRLIAAGADPGVPDLKGNTAQKLLSPGGDR